MNHDVIVLYHRIKIFVYEREIVVAKLLNNSIFVSFMKRYEQFFIVIRLMLS
jgi:hypothetical protein